MKYLISRMAFGSMLLAGLGLAPAFGQPGHEGHRHGHGEAPVRAVAKCPVTGEPVNFAVSTSNDDGPVFFCCKGCIPKYQAGPAKYTAKVAAQRKALTDRPKVQVTCPVTREPVDQKVFVESAGEKVFFCCKGCVKKYQADPKQYASALANGYTYQTKCPVMGEEIDPKSFVTAANGMNLYFCCKGCDKKFFDDPSKYASNLVAQGYTLNPKQMTHAKPGEHEGHDHGGHDHDHDD